MSLTKDKIINEQTTVLYKRSPSGKELYWSCLIDDTRLIIAYGQTDGTPIQNIISCDSIERAKQEYVTRVNAKIEREGYNYEGVTTQRVSPMLALTYDQSIYHDLPNKIAIQPKLDGIRCIATVNGLYSRTNNLITSAPHIRLACKLSPETILDGELYIPGLDFEEQLEIINRKKPHKRCYEIKYNVFDTVCEGSFQFRFNILQSLYHNWDSRFIKLVSTTAIDKESIPIYHSNFIEQGYEGSIIRTLESPYQSGVRSKGLLKHKDEQDCLADIVDITKGIDGKEGDCALFVCRLESGQIITVRPKMSLMKRQEIYKNRHKYLPTLDGVPNSDKPLYYTEIRHYGVNRSGDLRQARAYGINKK